MIKKFEEFEWVSPEGPQSMILESGHGKIYSKEEIEEFFQDILDECDSSIFVTVRNDYVSVIIFIDLYQWNSNKNLSKMISNDFWRLRKSTELAWYDNRDQEVDIKREYGIQKYFMVSRNLKQECWYNSHDI